MESRVKFLIQLCHINRKKDAVLFFPEPSKLKQANYNLKKFFKLGVYVRYDVLQNFVTNIHVFVVTFMLI